jgi:hypothetical protein
VFTPGEPMESGRVTGGGPYDAPMASEQPWRDPGIELGPPPATARTAVIRSSAELRGRGLGGPVEGLNRSGGAQELG